MILDGNSRVGNAKVYATQKEWDQEKEISRLKALLKQAEPWVRSFEDEQGQYWNKEDQEKVTVWIESVRALK